MKNTKIFTILLISLSFFLIQSCNKEPVASFTVTPEEVYFGDTVYFTNKSVNADVYKWSFENGEESIEENPTYIFNSDWPTTREYTVTLEAKAKWGYSDMTSKKITVHPMHEHFTGSYIGTETIDGVDNDVSVIISNNGYDTDLEITGLFNGGVWASATSTTKLSIVKNHPMHEQPYDGSGTLNGKSLHLIIIHTNIYTNETTTLTFIGEKI